MFFKSPTRSFPSCWAPFSLFTLLFVFFTPPLTSAAFNDNEDEGAIAPAPRTPVAGDDANAAYLARIQVLEMALAGVRRQLDDIQANLTTLPQRVAEAGEQAVAEHHRQEAARKAAQEGEEKRKEQERFDHANTKISIAVADASTKVAQALGVQPGSDLRKLATGEKKLLGKDAQHAVQEVRKGLKKLGLRF